MKTGGVSESMVPAYVFVVDIDPRIKDEGLTFHNGRNIERNVLKALLFKDRSDWFEKEISSSVMFPVDTPPTLLACGNLSYEKITPFRARRQNREKERTLAASAAACTTCRENPNGFLYVARVWWEALPDIGR